MKMNNNKNSTGGVSELCQVTSIVLLLIHIYFYYFPIFSRLQWETRITDRILEQIIKTGLFNQVYYSKGLALILLFLSILGSNARKNAEISVNKSIAIVLIGLLVYSLPVLDEPLLYIVCIAFGWALILIGATNLIRRLQVPWSGDDPFGRRRSGFPQERRLLSTAFSLHLKGWYTWKGRRRKSHINLINPRRGIMIMGSPGSGKSWFIIEPLIRQLLDKRFAMFIYDFKYDTLTKFTYAHFQANKHKYPPNTTFHCINFTDLSRSHRCNVLEPSTLNYLSDAIGASRTILLSINKTWVNRQGDFFVESPINFVAALIWYLRKYKDGIYCTLPHVIELSNTPYEKLFPLLAADQELETLIDPFMLAFQNKTYEMLDGQVAGAKIPLGRLSSPDLYYLLTGNDLTLDINNPAAPKIFCLGGDPARMEALAPVISLYIDRLTQICNRPGQHPCALVCDEFATVRAYNMAATVATGRSNNIIAALSIQDIAQLRTRYSQQEADTLLNLCGNLFCGQASGETSRWVSDRFPRILQDRASVSVSSTDSSVSTTQQWEPTVTQATVSSLSSGEFLGITADEPGKELELKTFHANIIRNEGKQQATELPVLNNVDAAELRDHYQRVKMAIANLVKAEGENDKLSS
jgi:hypothetical protein